MSYISLPGMSFITSATSPSPKRKTAGWISRYLAKVKAKRQAQKIMNSLHEVQQIREGKREGRTLDNFLRNF